MVRAVPPTLKTPRHKHTKVRSGCITWIRRIKCDEAKPSCLKCTSTGRKCDGYQHNDGLAIRFRRSTTPSGHGMDANHSSASCELAKAPPNLTQLETWRNRSSNKLLMGSPHNPLLDFAGTQLEQRSLGYFHHQTAPALSGYFDSGFWNYLIPRIGASEPAIQHAMLAVASMYENCAESEEYPDSMQQRFALLQYNKAIKFLKKGEGEGSKTLVVTLLTCILFVCLEFMRGNPELAMDHIESGLKILTTSRQARQIPSFAHKGRISDSPLSDSHSVEEDLIHIFSRLSIQSLLCGRRTPQPDLSDGPFAIEDRQSSSTAFSTMHDARLSLNRIFIQSLQRSNSNVKFDPSFHISEKDKSERENLLKQLQYWNSRLGLHIVDSMPNLRRDQIRGLRVLRILSIVAMIWNSTTYLPEETAYDSHREQFSTIISLAEIFIGENERTSPDTSETLSACSTSATPPSTSSRTPGSAPQNFTFEMGIIPALYFTAIKCRSPSLRRMARDMLLVITPKREGCWDARMLAQVSQCIIDFEEGPEVSEISWPAETRRIHGSYIRVEYGLDKRTQEVDFCSQPDGPGGDWRFWTVTITY